MGERQAQLESRSSEEAKNYPFKEFISTEKKRLLARADFTRMKIEEFEALEFYRSIKDVIVRLETTPIIPNFNKAKDRKHLLDNKEKCRTRKGIKTNTHRVIVIAKIATTSRPLRSVPPYRN